jgi:hypothetical protein
MGGLVVESFTFGAQDMWQCPKCRSEVDDSFEVCWSCGTTPGGIEDPNFVTADEADQVAGKEPEFDDSLEGFAGMSGPDLVECYMANNTAEAAFIANQLEGQGIPASADSRDGNLSTGVWKPEYAPKVRVRQDDLQRARAWLKGYEKRRKTRQDNLD